MYGETVTKGYFLEIMIRLGAITDGVSVRDLREDFEGEWIKPSALCMKLRRLHNQGLVTRTGRGKRDSPYAYKLTIKGIKRYDYLKERDAF